MSLSTVLLACSIGAGLVAGFAARYRRIGTTLMDLGAGLILGILFTTVATVVLVIAAGLNVFGFIHLVYLVLVVGFPIAVAIIVIPNLRDVEFRTPVKDAILGVLAIAAVAIGLWSTHVEPFRLRVDEQALGATGADQPVTIGVIADLQSGSIGDHERQALLEVTTRDPDVVLLPGDLFQIEEAQLAERLPEFLGWLRELASEVDHVIMVNGDVDDPEILSELAEESGVTFLDDEFIQLDVGGQPITFLGTSVIPETERGRFDPELELALAEATSQRDLVIAVSHHPDLVLQLQSASTIDLIVSGHTHGGQVSIPGFGPPVTFSNVPRTVAAGGLHVVNGHPIYVSTGVGIERGQAPQLRFRVRPTVGILTIFPS